jgi:hypothetical protein
MLGARTMHEWAHLAVDAGWVPCVAGDAELGAPWPIRPRSLADVNRRGAAGDPYAHRRRSREVGRDGTPADGLARIFLARISDYKANLLAQRFLARDEIETYVRHNIRTLRFTYAPASALSDVDRYLFELQYLGSQRGDRSEILPSAQHLVRCRLLRDPAS